ncbi:MAG: sodium:calcium antiporter, partial [Rhodospirillales bacterium]|nr:sodium:calcium antiporter [Rhodospirillales bacterium]
MTTVFEIIGGFILLLFGAEYLVRGAVSLATRLKVSPMIIGMTIVAYGTTAPELVVSLEGALIGQPGISVGNVIGSNIFNLLFVLGLVSSGKSDLPVDSALVGLNLPVMIAVALLALLFARTGHRIERAEGAVFLLI